MSKSWVIPKRSLQSQYKIYSYENNAFVGLCSMIISNPWAAWEGRELQPYWLDMSQSTDFRLGENLEGWMKDMGRRKPREKSTEISMQNLCKFSADHWTTQRREGQKEIDKETATSGNSAPQHTHKGTWMSTVALCIITKIWKQLRCPYICEWINCSKARYGILFTAKLKQIKSHDCLLL